MDRGTSLAAVAAGVLALSVLAAAAVPGVLADPGDDPVRPGRVELADLSIAKGSVGGATATLQVEARLEHYGNPTSNVTVTFRAVDAESGLLVAERSVDVGDLREDREVPVGTTLSVPREGGYRIETVVYRDGQRLSAGRRTLQGLDALTPDAAVTPVRFARSEVVAPVSISVARAGEDRTTLRVSAALTNGGDEPSGDLRVELVARQADSNLVADRASVAVGAIRPLRTAEATANLTVPTDYNYYVDAVLYRDDIVVDTARTVANLDPEERIEADTTVRERELDVSEFERGREGRAAEETPVATTSGGAPGFGPVVVVAALGSVALLARRWSA
jgi:PGF-CTERM protein